jgi:Methyltransferase domain
MSSVVVENTRARNCGDEALDAGRGPGQLPWYEFATRFVTDSSVLDVGTGLGKGLPILRQSAAIVRGQDLDTRLEASDIFIGPLSDISSKSVDVVTCIDVIEHIEDDQEFVFELARIAKRALFLTTPNWTASRCQWPYHIREYTPQHFEDLLATAGEATLFKGTPDGSRVFPIRHKWWWFALNHFRTTAMTAWPTRMLNNILPDSCRIHSHLAALVNVNL